MFQGLDLNDLMNKAKDLQKQLQEKRNQSAKELFEASVGGGMIRVKMNGNFELVSLEINNEILADKAILEDLMKAALNEVLRKVKESQSGGINLNDIMAGFDLSKLGGFTGGDKK